MPEKNQLSLNDLLLIIGDQTVEIRTLKGSITQYAQLVEELKNQLEEAIKLKEIK